ncbi:MAG: DNA methyltransferase [Anaerovoracaceae bacterium]
MSLIARLPHIMEEGRKKYEEVLNQSFDYSLIEKIGQGENILARGDNLSFMKYLMDEHEIKGKINLVYIDPPYFSRANYGTEIKLKSKKVKSGPVIKQRAYDDLWKNGIEEYLKMLIPRLYFIKDLIAVDGCVWVHLDWHSVHYIKIILDEIFGAENFINEVIWQYKSGGVSKRRFARKHDTLLFYGKSSDYYFMPQQEKSYNRGFKPYRFKGVAEYQDEQGWYTMVNMKDVWQINMVGRTSAERTGYATQKPEELLERILKSCTRENDICADFFGGSGTLAATAEKMNRKWISCDMGNLAILNTHKRLIGNNTKGYRLYEEVETFAPVNESSPKIDLKLEETPDKSKVYIKLNSYKIEDFSKVPVVEKQLSLIQEIMEEDSLQFIDYWSVDTNYQGDEFKPQFLFSRDNGGIQQSCQVPMNQSGQIAVRVVDIFGNSSFFGVSDTF